MTKSGVLSFAFVVPAGRSHAERVGFEPTIPLPVYHLSRVASSTAPAPLQVKRYQSRQDADQAIADRCLISNTARACVLQNDLHIVPDTQQPKESHLW